jgi:hypothetical protein
MEIYRKTGFNCRYEGVSLVNNPISLEVTSLPEKSYLFLYREVTGCDRISLSKSCIT